MAVATNPKSLADQFLSLARRFKRIKASNDNQGHRNVHATEALYGSLLPQIRDKRFARLSANQRRPSCGNGRVNWT